jgi:hypothetical protein
MKKAFLRIAKVKEWFFKNRPEDVLLAKLDDGTIPVKVIDDGVEQDVYLSLEDEQEIMELEVEMINDLEFKAIIKNDDGSQRYLRIFKQPEKDAWIEWREIP